MIASHLWPLSGIHTSMLPQRIPTLLKASIRVCALIRFSAISLYLKNSLDQTGFETTVHVTSNISESIEIRGNPLQITVSCLCLVYRMSVSSLAMWVQLHLKFNPTLLEVWPNFTRKFDSTSLELWVCSKIVLHSRLLWGWSADLSWRIREWLTDACTWPCTNLRLPMWQVCGKK